MAQFLVPFFIILATVVAAILLKRWGIIVRPGN